MYIDYRALGKGFSRQSRISLRYRFIGPSRHVRESLSFPSNYRLAVTDFYSLLNFNYT